MSETTNPLALQLREAKLPESESSVLESVFLPFFKQAEEWKSKAEALVVTSADDKEQMKEARTARLIIKDIRVNVEKRRKELKEDSLRKGKLIDAMANIIKAVIEPIEEHLDKQEKFVQIQEEKKRQRIKEERTTELIALSVDVAFLSDLGEMTDENYAKLLESSRASFNLVNETAEKAEKERIAREKADAEERERMRVENERLKIEAEAREKTLEAERVKAAAAQKKKDDENNAKLETERLAKKKAEDELLAIKREEERIERERKDAETKAQRAPDKEKLLAFAEELSAIRMPEVTSPEAREILSQTVSSLSSASKYLKTQALAL